MSEEQSGRLDFGHFVDRIFWALMTSAAIYAAAQLKQVSASVDDLNTKMSMLIERTSNSEKRMDMLERRIERIEFKHR